MIPCRVQFVPLTAPPKKNDQVQKHSETALDTPKKEGTESSFPVRMHLIVLHKACLSVKFHDFTDKVVKMTVPSVKWQVFTDDLKKHAPKQPLRWCNRGAKRKMQMLGFMHMHKHKLKRRISAASSASARLSQKVAAAGTPD